MLNRLGEANAGQLLTGEAEFLQMGRFYADEFETVV